MKLFLILVLLNVSAVARAQLYVGAAGGAASVKWSTGEHRSVVPRADLTFGWRITPWIGMEASGFDCGAAHNTRTYSGIFLGPAGERFPPYPYSVRTRLDRRVYGGLFGPIVSTDAMSRLRCFARLQLSIITAHVSGDNPILPSIDPGFVIYSPTFSFRQRKYGVAPSAGIEWQAFRRWHLAMEVAYAETSLVQTTALLARASFAF